MDTFPTDALRPGDLQYRLAGVSMSGGPTLVGPGQTAELAAGGWWEADLGFGSRFNPSRLRLIRAMLMRMAGGSAAVVMPFVDEPQAPWGEGQRPSRAVSTPFSDGATFSDGSGWGTPLIRFHLESAIAENDGEAILVRTRGGHPKAGMLFSLFHGYGPEKPGHRGYCLDRVEPLGGDRYRVGFGPPARDSAPEGAKAEFGKPLTTMRLAPGADNWPRISAGWKAASSMKFVEDFDYLQPGFDYQAAD